MHHTLPSGQVATKRVDDDGVVTFDLAGTDATIDGLDAMELGRIATETLRSLAVDKAEIAVSGHWISAEVRTKALLSGAREPDTRPDRPTPNKTGRSGCSCTTYPPSAESPGGYRAHRDDCPEHGR